MFALYDDPTVDTTVVPIPSTVMRHGSHLCIHRGCLYGAGGNGDEGRRVWATSVLVPGLEQATRDQGLFYPATALTRDLGDTVTGLSVVPQSSGVHAADGAARHLHARLDVALARRSLE